MVYMAYMYRFIKTKNSSNFIFYFLFFYFRKKLRNREIHRLQIYKKKLAIGGKTSTVSKQIQF